MSMADRATLGTIALMCVVSDFRSGKIPNSMILAGLLCAVAGSIIRPFLDSAAAAAAGAALEPAAVSAAAADGLLRVFGGMCIPLVIGGALFLLRMIGAGDIKMLSMAGAFLGPAAILRCMWIALLAGAVFSAGLMMSRKNAAKRLLTLWEYLKETAQRREYMPYMSRVSADGLFCFSLPVLTGILFTGGYLIV